MHKIRRSLTVVIAVALAGLVAAQRRRQRNRTLATGCTSPRSTTATTASPRARRQYLHLHLPQPQQERRPRDRLLPAQRPRHNNQGSTRRVRHHHRDDAPGQPPDRTGSLCSTCRPTKAPKPPRTRNERQHPHRDARQLRRPLLCPQPRSPHGTPRPARHDRQNRRRGRMAAPTVPCTVGFRTLPTRVPLGSASEHTRDA
jgi:hypothetical protein